MTTALDAIPIFSAAQQGGVSPNLTGTKTADGVSSFHWLYSSLQSQAAQEIHETPESASSSDDASPTTNTKNLTTVAGGFFGKPKATQSGAAGSDSNPPLAVTSLSVPPILPQPLATFPEPMIANQPVSALQLSGSTISVPAYSTTSASQTGNQTGNQIQSQPMTNAVSTTPSVPTTIASPPNISAQSLPPQIQVPPYIAMASPANSNPGPIPTPATANLEDLSAISSAPQTITYAEPSFRQTPGPQTSSLQTPSIQTLGIQTPAPQVPTRQTSSVSMPSLQPGAPLTPDIQTLRQPFAATATSPTPESEPQASDGSPALSAGNAAMQESLKAQPVRTGPDFMTSASANAATTIPATASLHPSALQDTTLLAANSMLPNLAAPSPAPASNGSADGSPTPASPADPAITNQPQPVPSTPGNALISALMAAAPTAAVRPVVAGKNNVFTAGTAAPLLPTLRSSPSQMPSNDSTNLQNELSIASAVVFPVPSSNQPSVHTLVNSAALPVTATTHSAVGSSTPQNSPNTAANKITTIAPTSSPAQASSKNPPANATPSDSTADHSQSASEPAIQLSSQQPVPTPAPTNTTVAATTTVLPTASADPAVASHPQPPASAASTANASPAAAELPPATLPSPGPVQMAQMVTRATQSEMRIGLNTSAFGSVEVRTVVHAGDVGLSVGSERGDLHSLLSNELPTVANSLQQQSLRLTQVSFHQSGLSGNLSSGGGSQQQRFAAPPPSGGSWNQDESPEIAREADESYSLSRGAGLSILA